MSPQNSAPLLALAAAAFALPSCASAPRAHDLTLATLYSQTSAENAAAVRGVYQSANAQLAGLLSDASHSGALEQPNGAAGLPPAIILDVDETVLDNSPYEVRQIRDSTSYPEGWDAWCCEESADPIPGALEFTQAAAARGVTVFYVTNRKEHLKKATHANLVRCGFPMAEGVDTVLMRGGREEWTKDKTSRRAHVASSYRIVMLFGDNTGDFLPLSDAEGTVAERMAAVAAQSERWGRSWFMLPNPMYGGWDGATFDYKYDRKPGEIHGARVRAMDARR